MSSTQYTMMSLSSRSINRRRLTPLALFVGLVSLLHAPLQAQVSPRAATYIRSVHNYAPPSVRLVDAGGGMVKFDALLAAPGPVLLQFIFTSCTTICPILSATVSAAQNRFSPDMRIISVSLDPETDTPARLAEYAARFRGRRQWIFLTGSLEDIAVVQRSFDAADNGGKMNHRPLTFLRSAPDSPWVRLEGMTSAAELVAEYQRVAAR
jgi:protein SCO1/2